MVLWSESHSKAEQWAVVETYCFECHNRDDRAGDRAFDRMSPDHIAADAEVWEAAIRKLRGGLMPPAGATGARMASPAAEFVSWLENKIDAAADEPPPGTRRRCAA